MVQTHRMHSPRVDPNVNCELRVVMMCLYRFRDCRKRTTLLGNAASSEAHPRGDSGLMGNLCACCSVLL